MSSGKPRQKRGRVMWASRDSDCPDYEIEMWDHEPERIVSADEDVRFYPKYEARNCASFGGTFPRWPGPTLAPGEVRKVRVTIEWEIDSGPKGLEKEEHTGRLG